MPPLRRPVSLLLVAALVGAACSGSDDASDTTPAPHTTAAGEATPTTTDDGPAPTAPPAPQPTEPTAPGTTSPPTTEPEAPAVPVIEDVLVDVADVRMYSTYQRALAIPYDDPQPDDDPSTYDRATTPCAFNWTRNWANDEGSDYRYLAVRACEFPDMAAADAYEDRFLERTTDLDWFNDDFVVGEPYALGEWSGRFGETAVREDDQVFRHWNLGRRHGLRYFEVTARDQLVESEAEEHLAELVAAQDELLDALGIEPDTPGPGFVDAAARVAIDDVLLPWAELVELGGEAPEDWSSSFRQQLDDVHRTRIVDVGGRQVDFPSGSIWVRAKRFVTETDAAGELVDVGGAEPIEGIANAFRSAIESDGIDSAWFVAGDRRYEVDVSEALPGSDGGALVERVVAALVDHLDGVGLLTEPAAAPHPIPADPVVDIVPLGALDELPGNWHLSQLGVAVDPLTGAPMVSMSVEQVSGGVFSARRMDTDYVLGVDRGQFVDRFVPDVGSLEPGAWQQRVDEDVSLNGDTGERETYYSSFFVRHDDAVGLSVWPDNVASPVRADAERPLEDRYADQMESMVAIGRRLESAAGDADIESIRLVGRALWLVDQRHLRASGAEIELFDSFDLPNGFAVLGEPGADSPTGAVGDWWRPTDHLTGGDPSAADSWLRATLFTSSDDAAAHLASVVGDDAEPVAGNELGGIVLDGEGGVFATVRGRWYFELLNRGFGRDPDDRFGAENPDIAPGDVLRAAAVQWTGAIAQSGLG